MSTLGDKEITPLDYGDVPLKIINHLTLLPNAIGFEFHWHERIEFHRIIKGTLNLLIADKHLVLRPGDLSIIPPFTMHHGIAGSEGVVYNVLMFDLNDITNNSIASNKFLSSVIDGKLSFVNHSSDPELIAKADELVRLGTDTKHYNPLEVLGSMYQLMGMLYTKGLQCVKNTYLADKRFSEVIDYVNIHFCENISSLSLSKHFNYDEAYFCRKFKKYVGVTVTKFIQILRMDKARNLLINTSESIKDIASDCGFSDATYFSNCFHKLYDISPSALRQKNKK